VRIELVVRGVCCLQPGLPGKSDNIRVRSFLGRFLEHSRLFRFENSGGEPVILLGSADWMPRNFLRRVECVFPLRNKALRRRIEAEVIATYMERVGDAKELRSDGSTVPCATEGRLAPCAQDAFLGQARRLVPEDVSAPKKKAPGRSARRLR
jgi:polyphosphate kinase